jgi:hypothetical protein
MTPSVTVRQIDERTGVHLERRNPRKDLGARAWCEPSADLAGIQEAAFLEVADQNGIERASSWLEPADRELLA